MEKFLIYLNTKQHLTQHKSDGTVKHDIRINEYELKRFNVTLREVEASKHVKKVDAYYYQIIEVNSIDLSLIKPKQNLTELHRWMLKCLLHTELPNEVQATPYWSTFVKHRSEYAELFFKVDAFAGRVHTPISSMHRPLRPHILLYGLPTTQLDVAQMQPTLLANVLHNNIGKNAFTDAIFEGNDIYTMLQTKARLKSRDEAKKLLFKILFGHPSDKLEILFAGDDFIKWINQCKTEVNESNPHKEKTHSNLAWLLQNYEVKIMSEVWQNLAENGIPFASVHDEIIVPQKAQKQAYSIMSDVLSKHFPKYKITIDKSN
jgi:hypothetical protein